MYIFSMMSVVVLVVQLALSSPAISTQKMLFALRSAGVLIAYQGSLAILFLRRILNQLDMAPHSNVMQTAIGTDFGVRSPSFHTFPNPSAMQLNECRAAPSEDEPSRAERLHSVFDVLDSIVGAPVFDTVLIVLFCSCACLCVNVCRSIPLTFARRSVKWCGATTRSRRRRR